MKAKSLLLATALLAAPAFGAAPKQRQVEGTILRHKTVQVAPIGQAGKGKATTQNLVVQIKTSKGNERLVVDLGSIRTVPQIRSGHTSLLAQGSMVNIGEQEFLVARKAKLNDKEFLIQRPMMKQAQEEKKKRINKEIEP